MKRNLISYIYLCCLFIGITACVSEQLEDDTPSFPDNVKAIVLNLHTDHVLSELNALRATEAGVDDPLNENKIVNHTVFMFNLDGSLHKRIGNDEADLKPIDNTTSTLTIVVPLEQVPEFEGKKFDVLIVANNTVEIPKTVKSLSEMYDLIQSNTGLNHQEAQEKFLMDGKVSTTINWGSEKIFEVPDHVPLKRAASKIRIRIRSINVKEDGVDYEVDGPAEIKLATYTSKTSLIEGKPYPVKATELVTMNFYHKIDQSVSTSEGNYLTTSTPLYAYENDWTTDSDKETYLLLKLMLKSGGQAAKPYYYEIPVNYRVALPGMTDKEKQGLHKLQRNHLYDIVSSIDLLGGEEETKPFLLEASIGVQPWNIPDAIDGSISNAHYLIVNEKEPEMLNVATREISYLSDLPITIKISEVSYEVYNQLGQLKKVVWSGDGKTKTTQVVHKDSIPLVEQVTFPFDGVEINSNLENNKLTVTHPVPTNFVPFKINFTVTQVLPPAEQGEKALSEEVVVMQYPPKYITGEISPGPGGGTNVPEGGGYADFRYHSSLGLSSKAGFQINPVIHTITTLVNSGEELIGDPTGGDGRTKQDMATNQLISPQFIIASQHGMNLSAPQYTSVSSKPMGWAGYFFANTFGPYNRTPASPYYSSDTLVVQTVTQQFYIPYATLEERCYNYFEGEYGLDGDYEEHYIKSITRVGEKLVYEKASRMVKKTFKYKGRWRMPTMAEVKLIDNIQDNELSAVKYLLMGASYFSAYPGWTYTFSDNVWDEDTSNQGGTRTGNVRCVFDLYKAEDFP